MSINPLTNSAEQFIQAMHLTSQNEETVRDCIANYSTDPQTFCELVNYVVFQVMEKIKSFFGMSQWQRAQNLIKQRGIELLSTNPAPEVQTRIDEQVIRNNSLDDMADALMTFCLQANLSGFGGFGNAERVRNVSDLENYVANRRAYQIV